MRYMEDNTVSVSSLPQSFVDWVNEKRDVGKEQKAPFLRRYLLQIEDYTKWMEEREEGIQ